MHFLLRNLIRAMIYLKDNENPRLDHEWLRVTGSDYSGFYQEQLLYRCVSILGHDIYKLPLIIYTPLIIDWSGAKLSKTLYVKENAYNYLPNYLLNYKVFIKRFGIKGIEKLQLETENWLEKPYKLFRNYSVYYFMELFENE